MDIAALNILADDTFYYWQTPLSGVSLQLYLRQLNYVFPLILPLLPRWHYARICLRFHGEHLDGILIIPPLLLLPGFIALLLFNDPSEPVHRNTLAPDEDVTAVNWARAHVPLVLWMNPSFFPAHYNVCAWLPVENFDIDSNTTVPNSFNADPSTANIPLVYFWFVHTWWAWLLTEHAGPEKASAFLPPPCCVFWTDLLTFVRAQVLPSPS